MKTPKLLQLPSTVTKAAYKNLNSFIIRDAREDNKTHMEVWIDDENDIWIRHENPEAKHVELIILPMGMATDLMGVLWKVINER